METLHSFELHRSISRILKADLTSLLRTCILLMACSAFQLVPFTQHAAESGLPDGGVETVSPNFPPSIPSSANGDVNYFYEFKAYATGGAGCCGSGLILEGWTRESGTVANVPVTLHAFMERVYEGSEICHEPMTHYYLRCGQAGNWMTTPATFVPDSGCCGVLGCAPHYVSPIQFQGGGLLYDVQDTLGGHGNEDCFVLETHYSSGEGWEMWFTHPAYTPLCYYYSQQSCENGDGSTTTAISWGWADFYKVIVTVEQGATPPVLPPLNSFAAVGWSLCTNCPDETPPPSGPGGPRSGLDGLAAWWPLNGTASDSFAGNNGTTIGGGNTVFDSGQVGEAAILEGGPAGIEVSDNASLNFTANKDFTIIAWIWSVDQPGTQDIVAKFGAPDYDFSHLKGYALSVSDGQLAFRMSDSLTATPLTAGPAGPDLSEDWHHVAVTVDRSSSTGGKLYVDGALVQTFNPTSMSGDLTTTESLFIGTFPTFFWIESHERTFNGSIDEVSLFKRALTATDIAALYQVGLVGRGQNRQCTPAPANVVGWWPMQGDGSDHFSDNEGTIVGSGNVSFVTGQVGQAIHLAGSSCGVSVPDDSALNFGSGANFSIETWIKPATATTSYGVMSVGGKRSTPYTYNDNVALGYELCLVNGKLLFQISDSLSSYPLNAGGTGADLRDGSWHHVAVTVERNSSTGGKLYVDGQLITTFNPTSKAGNLTTTQPLLVGMHASSWLDCNFRGDIDEVTLYNRVLTASEIWQIHDNGVFGKCSPAP